MSDTNANIRVNIDTSEALANIKNLQRQISLFHQEMAMSGSAANAAAAKNLQSTLMKNIDATGQFRTQFKTIQSETEHFTEQLERNKMSVGQYFRFAGASTKTFGRLWKKEFQTIEAVATERVKTLQTQYIKMGRDANGALKAISVRPLQLDMQNLGTKTAIAAQKQQLLNQLLKQGSTQMLNWGKNTQWAGRQLMVGFTIPLAMAGTAAAKAYIDFEKAAIKFKRVYGDFNTSSGETDKMARSIQKLAEEYTKYGVAVADTMSMAADAAAMGKTGVDLLTEVQQAAKLSVLGNVDQAKSLETLTSLTNTFGLAAEELAGKIDFLNAVENQTSLSIDDMTEAIPKAAPVIKQLGGDVEDLTYMLTAMKEGGINASEGANAIKSGLASMINPSKAASDMLADLGINLKGIVDMNEGDPATMVKMFSKELDKLAPLDRSKAIEQLFGKFQFARMSTMFSSISREGSQANRVLEMTKMTTQELAVLSERELKKIESSPAFKFDKALKDIQAKLIPVGEAFLKAVTPVVEWVGKILDGFNGMGDGAKQFATMATLAIAGLGPIVLMTVGLIANGVANLIKMFASIKTFFNGTKGGTSELGQTTEYMTQTQLEAQSVASSLEQSHAKLTQQFTVEAQAIQALISEYERAITAQSRLAAGSGMSSGRIPGASTGGAISGPGTSTSDNLVAKVSNGEEVLSAATIAKGKGVIGGIIDRLPERFAPDLDKPGARRRKSLRGGIESLEAQGLGSEAMDAIQQVDELGGTASQASQILRNLTDAAKGGPEAVKNWMASLVESAREVSSASALIQTQKDKTGAGKSKVSTNFTHVGSGVEMSLQEAMDNGMLDGTGNEASAQKTMDKYNASGKKGAAPKFSVKSMFGMDNFDAKVNREMAANGASSGDFLAAFDSAGVDKWNTSIKAGGGNIDELNADLKMFDARIKEIIASSNAEKVFDSQAQATAYGPNATSVEAAVAQARSEASPQLQSAIDRAASTARETRVAGSIVTMKKSADQSKFTGALEGQFAEEMGTTPEEMKQIGKDAAAGLINGTAGPEGLDSRSPSRKMHQIGLDAAQGLQNGAKEGISKIPGVPTPPPVEAAKTSKMGGFIAKAKGIGADVAQKSMDVVADGLQKGKTKLIAAADSAATEWSNSIDRQIQADNELYAQRTGLAEQILQATDAEYNALKAEQDLYRDKLTKTNQATDAEIKAAVARDKALQQKRQAIVKDIENSGEDAAVIQQRLDNANKADMVNDLEASNANQSTTTTAAKQKELIGESAPMTYGTYVQNTEGMSNKQRKEYLKGQSKASQKQIRKEAFTRVGGGVQKAAMVGTAAAGALSMMPGPVGKAAQDATPLIGGMSMLAGLITGPVSGALVALVAIIGGIMFAIAKLDEAFKNSSNKQLELANKLGASSTAINSLAESSGRVTGSQYMAKVNEAKSQSLFATAGKTTFGSSFMEGDTGKGMLDAAKTSMASAGGSNTAVVANLSQQLSSAIISGALSKDEAGSIAASLAYELGDMNIAFKVQAQVMDIVGPDGKSFQDNPAKVAAKLYAQNAADTEALMGAPKGQLWSGGENNATNRNVTAGGTIAAMAGGGALLGAGIGAAAGLIGGPLAPLTSAVGAVAGAVIGTIGGAIVGTITAVGTLQADAEKAGKAAGSVVANMTQGLELQKQMSDQLDGYYTKLMEEAAANGDIAEYKRLQVEYDQKKKELGEENAKASQDMLAAYTGSADQGALDTAIDAGLDVKFKDNSDYALVQEGLNAQFDSMDKETGYGLKAQVYNGLDFTALSKFLATNDAGTDEQNTANDESTKKLVAAGGTRLSDTMSAASNITDQTVRTAFLTKVANETDDAEAKKMTDLAMQVNQLGGVMEQSINTMFNAIINDEDAQARIQEMTAGLTTSSNQTFEQTIDMVYEINPKLKNQDAVSKAQLINKEYFDSLNNEQQRDTYVSTANIIFEAVHSLKTFDDLKANPDFAKWQADPTLGGKYGDYPGGYALDWWKNTYAEGKAQEVTKAIGNTPVAPAPPGGGGGGGGGGGPKSHWTDDVVKNLRDTVSISQKLTVGINASTKALQKFGASGDTAFNGLANQLRTAGASSAMIANILDDEAKNISKFFKNGKLTAAGLAVQARMYQAALGNYVETQRQSASLSQDQAVAMRKLTAAGMSYAAATEAVQDAELAAAVAHGATAAQIKKIAAEARNAAIQLMKVKQATPEGRAENEIEVADSKTAVLQAQSDQYQTGLDMIASKEDTINKQYDKRAKALEKVLQINQDIAESQKGQLDLVSALSSGDIFAAAKAMSAQKAQAAQRNAEQQKTALSESRDYQVSQLTSSINGQNLTREQIETRIKDINDKILKIKHDEIDANKVLLAQSALKEKLDIAKEAGVKNAQTPGSKSPNTGTAGGGNAGGGPAGGNPAGGPAGTAKKLNPKYAPALAAKNAAAAKVTAAKAAVTKATNDLANLKNALSKIPKSYSGLPMAVIENYERQKKALPGQITGKQTEIGWAGRGITSAQTELAAATKTFNATPQYLNSGGSPKRQGFMRSPFARGMDVMPSMIGLKEFVMSAPAVKKYGMNTMKAMNEGRFGESQKAQTGIAPTVYNYSIDVNVAKSDASAEEIASAVIKSIKGTEQNRIGGR